MNRNRTAGHDFELEVVNALKKTCYPHAKTSRSENRTRDAEKIDIVNHDEYKNGRLPYNIQCKNAVSISYSKVLEEIEKTPGITNVVFHKKTEKVGNKFMPRGKYAFLHMSDFLTLMEDLESLKSTVNTLDNYLEELSEIYNFKRTK